MGTAKMACGLVSSTQNQLFWKIFQKRWFWVDEWRIFKKYFQKMTSQKVQILYKG